MRLHRLSVRVILGSSLAAMALLAALLAWMSGRAWHADVINSQREWLSEQLRLRLADLRRELDARSHQIIVLAASAPALAAVKGKKPAAAGRELDALFERAGAVFPGLKLARLELFDDKLKLFAVSTRGVTDAVLAQPPCRIAREVLMKRMLAQRPANSAGVAPGARAAPAAGLCVADMNVYHLLLEPLGRSPAAGYLLVASDVTPVLIGAENLLGAPLRLTLGDGAVLYRSPRWVREDGTGTHLTVEQPLGIFAPARSVLNVAISRDIRPLHEQLAGSTSRVAAVASGVALLAACLLWFILRRTVVQPLGGLLAYLRRVRAEERALEARVPARGSAELAELSAGLNDLVARLKALYDGVQSIALTDPLTRLPNRTMFHQLLREAIENARQDYKPFALFLMDLDRFKDINDTLGHQAGDELLQQVAARLRGKLRDTDTLARMGGDEFGILLPAVGEKHAAMAARMLLQALRAPFPVADQMLDIGASLGVALYPDHGVDANLLIQRADIAMYAAKQANCGHAFYDSKQDQHSPTRLTMLGELRHAVEQEQFVLYFQPKVDLKRFQVAGVEALVRWNHPRENLVLPDTFVPLMEQTGLIRSLTPWVLTESLKQGQALQNRGMPIAVSLNLSVRDLQDPNLADTFAEQLEALQVSPRLIGIEITESAMMTDPQRTYEVLVRLASLGLRIAIDDFGTGYSSLAYLKKLPVHTIKIDKSFVLGMMRNENDAAIVRTSIDLGHDLGLEVVAEGVETEDVLRRLSELGCDIAQGHYISRPLSAQELSEWLQQSSWGPAKHNPKLVRLHS
jgi:diguanylate cyclase (GGDEF)-like protein